ncbi:MAG: dephospho-CoA kinase [Eggerthellaceae bacterium]|nr:dephospho-CoA kinase [Eggerthellaceae bacterium]
MAKVVALIGGIGSGKTTVAGMFAARGAAVIDLDAVGHSILEKDYVIDALTLEFGPGILENGTISRPKLARAAFVNENSKETLNNITHPAILEEMKQHIQQSSLNHAVVVVEVTSGPATKAFLSWAHVIVAVHVDEDERLRRALSRGNLPVEEIKRRMTAQASENERLEIADFVVDGNASLPMLALQVTSLYKQLAV